jgi:hypothetical protein
MTRFSTFGAALIAASIAAGCAVQPVERASIAPASPPLSNGALATEPAEPARTGEVLFYVPPRTGVEIPRIPTEARVLGPAAPAAQGAPVVMPAPAPAAQPGLIPGATAPMPRPEDWVPPETEPAARTPLNIPPGSRLVPAPPVPLERSPAVGSRIGRGA